MSKAIKYGPDSRYYCLFILWHEMNTFHELSTHCVSSNLYHHCHVHLTKPSKLRKWKVVCT